MQKITVFLFIAVIFYGIYNSLKKQNGDTPQKKQSCRLCETKERKVSALESELSRIDSVEYLKKYIIDVIDHGSSSLGFKGGVMEGGYVSKEDSHKIACYVVGLSGKSCKEGYEKDARMFYTSVCGGCHGNDGKGVGGSYPDLTRDKLLGIKKREEFLKLQIKKLGHKEHL